MERRKFTREYKLEAVRLIKERGVSYVQASQDLGVHVSQLRDWVKNESLSLMQRMHPAKFPASLKLYLDKLSLADFYASLERAAYVLGQKKSRPTPTVKCLQQRSCQRRL